MNRKIDDQTYLKYLLQGLNVKDLKEICKDFQIKGYSKFAKAKLIEFIIDSLAEEEFSEVLKQKELEIISKEIELALSKIKGEDKESISNIKIVNPEQHEIEVSFKGFNWETTSFISITNTNIDDPERDCDCRIGSNMGLCSHFWVGMILSLKESYFKLSEWTLTELPDDFEKKIESIKLSKSKSADGKSEAVSVADEGSDSYQFMKHINKSITVYEGEIEDIIEKQQDFQGNITTYYIVSLKDVKFGPRVQKKSDFREEDVEEIENLKLRISEKLKGEQNIENGDKVSGNGKLTKDNILGFIVKNIRKLTKI